MLYDIHLHLDSYDDPSAVVRRAAEAGVKYLLTNGIDAASNARALALAEEFPMVHAALGLYPNEGSSLSREERQALLQEIRAADPVAIGEIGIDYHHDDTKKEEMNAVFVEMLALAKELNKPVLVHSRKAEVDVLDILGEHDVVADLHCFGGSLKLARRGVELGCYFSIPASIVKATHFQRLVEETPIEHLLTETDSPWLSPDEEPNEPRNIPLVVREIARIKGLPADEVTTILWENAQRFLAARPAR